MRHSYVPISLLRIREGSFFGLHNPFLANCKPRVLWIQNRTCYQDRKRRKTKYSQPTKKKDDGREGIQESCHAGGQ